MELYNAMERNKLNKVSIKTHSKLAWWRSSKASPKPWPQPPWCWGWVLRSLRQSISNLFWIRPFIDIKTGVHTAVWNFHTPVWVFRSRFISNFDVYLKLYLKFWISTRPCGISTRPCVISVSSPAPVSTALWNFHRAVGFLCLLLCDHHTAVGNFHTAVCLLCLLFCDRYTAVGNFHTAVWNLCKAAFESAVLRFDPFSRRPASTSLLLHRGHLSGTQQVVGHVFSSFCSFLLKFSSKLTRVSFTNTTAFVPLHLDE